MTAGDSRLPARGMTGRTSSTMSKNSDKERGEKRGVLGSGRAKRLDKTKDADESAADDED